MPIVAATAIAVDSLYPERRGLAKRIEEAMSAAVMRAHLEGVTDPEIIRERMHVAKAAALLGESASL